MSKEAENLLKAITDLATRLSDEWCRKSDAETKGLDLNEIYDKQATALIDAALAKVREKCADRARKAVMDERYDYKGVKIMIPLDIRDAVAESVYAAILGKDK